MTVLPVQVASAAVTFSVGLYLAVALMLVLAPILDAIAARRRPRMPQLWATVEYVGVALAITGFAGNDTGLAAVGVAMTVAVTAWNAGRISQVFDPAVHAVLLVCGLVSLGALAEFHYFMI